MAGDISPQRRQEIIMKATRRGFMTPKEMAELMGVSYGAVTLWVKNGLLKAEKEDGRTRIALEDALAFRRPTRKLSASDVRRIREMAGRFSHADIAEQFGIHPSYVGLILRGKRRGNVR